MLPHNRDRIVTRDYYGVSCKCIIDTVLGTSVVNLCSWLLDLHVYVCGSVRSHTSKTTCTNFTKCSVLCMLPVAAAQSCANDSAIHYVLPVVLRMWSCFHIMGQIQIQAIDDYYGRLRSRCGHYIFALWFLSTFYLLFFIPRLISAAADWMSTILPHMVWP